MTKAADASSFARQLAVFVGPLAAGASADFVVSADGSLNHCGVVGHAITSTTQTAISDFAAAYLGAVSTGPTGTVTRPTGGSAIGYAWIGSSTGDTVWTANVAGTVVEDADFQISSGLRLTSAHIDGDGDVELTANGADAVAYLVAAISFGP